jgi:3-oxoadipate enol-lactonase
MPTITANGIELYYELHGPADADVLALSNGILMSTASWAYQTAALARHYRLLLYDCRGMWQSAHPPGPYSMAQHADDLAALLDGLNIDQAHVGGASYGAEISLVFALKYPQRTRSLIAATAVSEIGPLLRSMTAQWLAAAAAHDPGWLFRTVAPLTFSGAWIAANQALLEQARARYETLDFDAFLALLESFLELDISAELHRISAPTLVVAAENDILKPRPYSEIIARAIPNAHLAIIPHAGHAAMWEQPGLFNALILGFLAQQGGE